jgi:hypothetical protein
MKSARQRDVGPRLANPVDQAPVFVAGVLAVHRREDPVGAGFAPAGAGTASACRQVAMGGDELLGVMSRGWLVV